jgi:hypothetical protein
VWWRATHNTITCDGFVLGRVTERIVLRDVLGAVRICVGIVVGASTYAARR